MASKLEDIRKFLPEVQQELWKKANVVATGIGYKVTNGKKTGDLCLVCSVETKKERRALSSGDFIQPIIQNIPTDVLPTGTLRAIQGPTGRFRPAPGGVSIGHVLITAGTLGCLVKKGEKFFILSNNHVLANSNDASAGDVVLQPGPADGGRNPEDQLARLSEFVPLEFEGGDSSCVFGGTLSGVFNRIAAIIGSRTRLRAVLVASTENKVDCAIAEPLDPANVKKELLGIGEISSVGEGTLGASIRKSGRTTGVTSGVIEQIDVTSRVSYGSGSTATFVDQLMAGNMSQGGDSGSAVLDKENRLVGLLFAGSDTTTVINRIQNVFQALDLTLP